MIITASKHVRGPDLPLRNMLKIDCIISRARYEYMEFGMLFLSDHDYERLKYVNPLGKYISMHARAIIL